VDAAERERDAERARAIRGDLAGKGIVGLATTWIDNSGVTRVKAVPLAQLESAARWGIGASPVFDGFLADDSIVAGRFAGGPIGDLRLHPDLSRVTVLAAQPGWAWAPAVRYRQDGSVHPQDARSVAQRAVDDLRSAGFTARMAFEIEWALSASGPDGGSGFVPAATGPAYGYTRLAEQSDYLRDLLLALDAEGVAVDQIHPEYGAGQFEVSVAAEDPVGAADTFALVRETIRAHSLRRSMHASFSPKVEAVGVGNGGHLHLSLQRDGAPVFSGGAGPHGMTEAAEHFAAGILDRLPALLAIGAPSVASYLRLVPSHWAGAFQAWGLENREAALRLVTGSPGNTGAANLEVKVFDQSANPYHVVAAVIFAGMAGIRSGAKLPAPVDVDPASLSDDERGARGIRALPTSLDATTDAFESDGELARGFGAELAATIVELRRADVARFADRTAEDVVAASRWKY
jgi:glutamine synthetase